LCRTTVTAFRDGRRDPLADTDLEAQMLDDVQRELEAEAQPSSRKTVSRFRQILLWPVQLSPGDVAGGTRDHASIFAESVARPEQPWQFLDVFAGAEKDFGERHYNEFVTFLPPVQRFLYGSGRTKGVGAGSSRSPITTFRRTDIASLRVELTAGADPIQLGVVHADLYFFFEIDIAILAIEIYADDISLADAQEVMFRLGRTHPAYWEKNGAAGHCPAKVEFLSKSGEVLAASDYENRSSFMSHVYSWRSARVAAHWQYLLHPLVPYHSGDTGLLRFKQLEYYRMPQMAFVAMRKEDDLTRADYVRLAFASGPGECSELPFSERHLENFEQKFCYDRYFGKHNEVEWPQSRYMSCGHTLVLTGNADNPFFIDGNHGCLNSFRREHFLVFLIAHFHKAALLMFSDHLTGAMSRLDTSKAGVLAFRTASRRALQKFLRFTHRYWFHSVSNQTQAHDLFALCRSHLEVDRLHDDIQDEIRGMNEFLENDALRRQNDTVTRLTVVTTLGLIGTTVTGFLGMNLLDWANQPTAWRIGSFLAVLVPTIALTFITIAKSRALSDMMEALSEGGAKEPRVTSRN
jgi:hypothetical protein